MSICAYPQVRIYEDFDKMSAKEVYYNEAGNKITVKLLHYPDISPDEFHKLRFDDDDANGDHANSDQGITGTNEVAGAITMNSKQDKAESSNNSESESEVCSLNGNERDNEEEGDGKRVTSEGIEPLSSTPSDDGSGVRKPLRKKSSGNLMHKCSKAFAKAHGISTTTQPLVLPSIIPPPGCASIMDQVQLYGAPSSPSSSPGVGTSAVSDAAGFGVNSNPSKNAKFGSLRKNQTSQSRRSPSPANQSASTLCPGYAQYQKSLLEVPMPRDYGDASSDDLSSEWDSDVPETKSAIKDQKVLILHSRLMRFTKLNGNLYRILNQFD